MFNETSIITYNGKIYSLDDPIFHSFTRKRLEELRYYAKYYKLMGKQNVLYTFAYNMTWARVGKKVYVWPYSCTNNPVHMCERRKVGLK